MIPGSASMMIRVHIKYGDKEAVRCYVDLFRLLYKVSKRIISEEDEYYLGNAKGMGFYSE